MLRVEPWRSYGSTTSMRDSLASCACWPPRFMSTKGCQLSPASTGRCCIPGSHLAVIECDARAAIDELGFNRERLAARVRRDCELVASLGQRDFGADHAATGRANGIVEHHCTVLHDPQEESQRLPEVLSSRAWAGARSFQTERCTRERESARAPLQYAVSPDHDFAIVLQHDPFSAVDEADISVPPTRNRARRGQRVALLRHRQPQHRLAYQLLRPRRREYRRRVHHVRYEVRHAEVRKPHELEQRVEVGGAGGVVRDPRHACSRRAPFPS